MEVYGIKEVLRSDGIERLFTLISLLFSDEVLSFEYVFKCLKDWKTNTTFNFVVLSNINCNVQVVLEEIYENLSEELIEKMKSLTPVNEFVKKIERVVCFKCRNYGSIISGRDPSVSQIRFICENCRFSTLDPISDLVWSRRCGEISHSQYKQFEALIANIRSELFQVMENLTRVETIIQSMMIIQNVKEVNLSKLLCLFTVKKHRGNQNGQHMIETIPRIIANPNAMLSICTAGLDSLALFSYYLRFSRPVKYSKFGDLLEQDEFNAVSFYSEFGCSAPQTFVNSHNVVGIMHKLNIVYFYSLCRFLMNTLSQDYAPECSAGISTEKFNLVMRGASYEKSMTAMNLNDIQKECIDFDVNIHQVVELFHSLLNKPSYNYELHQKTEYDSFCQTLFPNRFKVLDDFSGVELQFVEEDSIAGEDSIAEMNSSVIDMSMNKVFDDSCRDNGHHNEMVSFSLNDTINTIGEEPIASYASGPDTFQEGLELAFSEYKSLESKYVLLQKEYHTLQEKHNDLQIQIEHMNECLNQQNGEFDDLKEAYTSLQEDKVKQDIKLKDFVSSLGI